MPIFLGMPKHTPNPAKPYDSDWRKELPFDEVKTKKGTGVILATSKFSISSKFSTPISICG
jgi:hypothetical protein